ncbi:asparagine synthetase B [Vallitalea longa]|uniref:asparagine synthase (glutamine-hydrolyzing) n=1 Tax=Vallitalea longa TaxID=2936439 RepID=A0A9W5YDC2_9FIRM|nr:asparagine synthase (glutamine-hydrolyzing) [Vallitalea longa]GKX32005.1 asparagine synthetase B [Vallitalea longa]
MCGIAGIVSLGNDIPNDFIKKMVGCLVHRGPDAEGYYCNKDVQLGSRRLKIIDCEKGGQPLINEDGTVIAMFNGEIYNYRKLTNQLINKGHIFKSHSDSEVLVHLYEEYGIELLDKIDGQFAFAIYDKNNEKVFIARDRIGICPLFYSVVDGIVYFASEIKAIASTDVVDLRPSITGLYEQFVYWSPMQSRTIYENINQIPLSGYAVIDKKNSINIKIYHHFSDYREDIGFNNITELKDKIRSTLIKSIMERLNCDSNIKWGLYLSGGLDSTILIKLLKELGYDDFPTFSLGFKDYKLDESAYQLLGLKGNKGQHIKITVSDEDIISHLPDVIKHCEVPLYKLGAVPMYMLSNAVNEYGAKFVLSGEGADELFYGYDVYKETLFRKYCSLNPNSNVRFNGVKNFIQFNNNSHVLKGYKEYYSRFYSGSEDFLYSMKSRIFGSSSIINYFNRENKASIDIKKIDNEIQEQFFDEECNLSLLKKCQAVQMKILLSGYLLSTQGDRVLMANSIEGRYPFLDRDLIKLAYAIPDNYKLSGYDEKHILKETFADIIPKAILKRTKYQYSTPGSRLFINNMEQFESYLSKDVFYKYSIFDYHKTMSLIEKLKNNKQYPQKNIIDDMILIYIITTHMLLEMVH